MGWLPPGPLARPGDKGLALEMVRRVRELSRRVGIPVDKCAPLVGVRASVFARYEKRLHGMRRHLAPRAFARLAMVEDRLTLEACAALKGLPREQREIAFHSYLPTQREFEAWVSAHQEEAP